LTGERAQDFSATSREATLQSDLAAATRFRAGSKTGNTFAAPVVPQPWRCHSTTPTGFAVTAAEVSLGGRDDYRWHWVSPRAGCASILVSMPAPLASTSVVYFTNDFSR